LEHVERYSSSDVNVRSAGPDLVRPITGRPKTGKTITGARKTVMKTIWGEVGDEVDESLCFVLMPLPSPPDKLSEIYELYVERPFKELGMKCKRADNIFTPGVIMKDIWDSINRAAVIIAELTNKNANVFYELGMAHALGKETILIMQRSEVIPFDVQGIRLILYDDSPKGYEKLEQAIRFALKAILGERRKRNNKLVLTLGDAGKLVAEYAYKGKTLEQTIEFVRERVEIDEASIERLYKAETRKRRN
jgi:hypothetical protein